MPRKTQLAKCELFQHRTRTRWTAHGGWGWKFNGKEASLQYIISLRVSRVKDNGLCLKKEAKRKEKSDESNFPSVNSRCSLRALEPLAYFTKIWVHCPPPVLCWVQIDFQCTSWCSVCEFSTGGNKMFNGPQTWQLLATLAMADNEQVPSSCHVSCSCRWSRTKVYPALSDQLSGSWSFKWPKVSQERSGCGQERRWTSHFRQVPLHPAASEDPLAGHLISANDRGQLR